jgi:peptidoglycan/xylan/chitin deacetylase (PgdA/CDA1 family)
MSWDEIRMMRRAGMSIGSHTHSHRILAGLPEADQIVELARSKETLEQELGRTVDTISYPVGDPSSFTLLTQRLARAMGYRLGLSYYGGVNRVGHADPLDVRRFGIERYHTLPRFRTRVLLHHLVGITL